MGAQSKRSLTHRTWGGLTAPSRGRSSLHEGVPTCSVSVLSPLGALSPWKAGRTCSFNSANRRPEVLQR